jgi:mannosyltransferase
LAWAAALIGIAATALAAIGSWIPSLWGDEATSILSATRPLPSLLSMLMHVDAVHGLYYLGLRVWVDVFGPSAFSVRLPSAFAVGVCAAAVTWMCGRARSLRFAVLAGTIAVVLPRLTYAGEEARSFAFSAAFAAVLCAIVVEVSRRPSPSGRWWVWYAVVLSIGTWAFLYFMLMTLAVGAAVLLVPTLRPQWRRWLAASGAASVIAAPLLLLAATQTGQIAYLRVQTPVTVESVFVQMWFGSVWVAVIAWLLIIVAATAAVRALLRARTADGERTPPLLETLALCWLLIPMGLLLAVSPLLADFTSRYGTYAAPAAAILIAAGIRTVVHALTARGASPARRAVVGGVLIAVMLGVAAPAWASQRTPYAKNESDWNDIARTISTQAVRGDAIVFDDAARPSRRPRLAMNTAPAMFADVSDVTLKSPYPDNPTWHDTVYTVAQAAARGRFDGIDRVWVVEYKTEGITDTWGVKDLQQLGFHETRHIDGHSSEILLYERRIP